jgi:hypothetical protein
MKYKIISVIILLARVSGYLRIYELRLIYSSGVKGGSEAAVTARVIKRRRPLDFIR